MTVYDGLLEKTTKEAAEAHEIAVKAARRAERIGRMADRARRLSSYTDTTLCSIQRDVRLSDPVYVMLEAIMRTYSSPKPGREAMQLYDEFREQAVDLHHQIFCRTMKEETYNALDNETHPIYEQAKTLGMDIKPGMKK